MSLEDFLKSYKSSGTETSPSVDIAAWQAAISGLLGRFKASLGKYSQLTLNGWTVLREHRRGFAAPMPFDLVDLHRDRSALVASFAK
jgi:hypothetical protein